MRISTISLIMLMLASLLSIGSATAVGDDATFLIFKEGAPKASITLPPDATDDLRKAVEVFRETLRAGYEVDIPLTRENDGLDRIELVLEKRTLLTEDHTVVSFPSRHILRITGGESGLMRTLFVILEKHGGLRFLYQGAMSGSAAKKRVYYPPLTHLVIPTESFIHDSAFPFRRATVTTNKHFGVTGGGEEVRRYFWNWQMQLGAKDRVKTGHALGADSNRHRKGRHDQNVAFPIDLYVDGSVNKPFDEVFPILGGKRFIPYLKPKGRLWHTQWQPCFTSKAAEDEAVKNILAFMQTYPDTTSLSLAVNDNGNHCECETCMKMDGQRENAVSMPDRSPSYYDWVNRVVGRVTSIHPDLMFGVNAYREVFEPPQFKIHPNVMVEITMDYHATIDAEVKASRQALIRQWNEKASHISGYSYDVGNWFFSLPRVYFQQMQEMIQFLHEHGGKANFSEGAHYFTLTEGPRMYLYFKLLENPYLDREAVIRDWCQAAVGNEAAGPLYDYFMFWENYWRTEATKVKQFWDRRGATYLQRHHFATYVYGVKPGDMAHCRDLMEQVLAHANSHGTQGQKERAELLMTCFEWFEAAADATSAQWINTDGDVASAADAVSLLKDIPKAVKAHERWRNILTDTREWIASAAVLSNDKPGVVGFNMAQVFEWTSDHSVQTALNGLVKDSSLPVHLQRLAMILRDGQAASIQPVVDDTFESSASGWDITHPIYGGAVPSTKRAAQGQSALECQIEHSNYTLNRPLPDLKKQFDYFVTARVFIDAAASSGDVSKGTVTFSGTPLPVGWDLPEQRLSSGQWHTLHAYIPRSSYVDADRLASEMGGVNSVQDIKDMLTGKLVLRLRNFDQGSKVYLDDVKVYELSDVK